MSTVAVQKTSPGTVLVDYANLIDLANYQDYLPEDKKTIIKLNLSWSLYFPACSTEPWQLEGILKTWHFCSLCFWHWKREVMSWFYWAKKRGGIAKFPKIIQLRCSISKKEIVIFYVMFKWIKENNIRRK